MVTGNDTPRACAHCGQPIETKASAKAIYCSKTCKGRAASRKRHAEGCNEGERASVTACCHACGAVFTRRKRANDTRDAGRYCTRDCYNASRAVIAAERQALAVIAENWMRSARQDVTVVHAEIMALRRIASWRSARRATARPCRQCGRKTKGRGELIRVCAACKRAQVKKYRRASPARRAEKARRRAIERGANADRIDPIVVFDRHKWRCHICGCKTPRELRGSYAGNAPELDHVIPLAAGGTHTWGNVACACRACNGAKSARPMGQLGLELGA